MRPSLPVAQGSGLIGGEAGLFKETERHLCGLNLQGVAVEEIEKKMPNLITPNGDDKNDYFDPLAYIQANESPTDGILEQLFIYNRWGELLRRYPRYPKGGWDGADEKGHVPPQATYYFLLEYQIGGKAYRRTGPVNLLH